MHSIMGEILQRIKNIFSSSSNKKEDLTNSRYVKQVIYNLKNVSPKAHQFLKEQSESQSENMREITIDALEWFVEGDVNTVEEFKEILKRTEDEVNANNLTQSLASIVHRYIKETGYQPPEELQEGEEEEIKGEKKVEKAVYNALANKIENGGLNLNNLQPESLDVGPLTLGTPEKKTNIEEQLLNKLMESNTPLNQKIDNYTKLKKEAGARPTPSSLFKDILTKAIDQGQLDVGSIIENFMTPKTDSTSSRKESSEEDTPTDIEFNIKDNRTTNESNEKESEDEDDGGEKDEGD